MTEKLTFGEFCARGGRSRSAVKVEAARNNLEKAKAALAAAFVGGRAFARSLCSFRRAAPAFLLCIANPLVVRAEQLFERAGVTKTINAVSVLPRNTKAVPGDVITKDLALKTGGDSRAELEFPDLTITRVGANALFRFLAGKRQIILDGGTMLFHAPKGAGGGKVEAGAITAAVTGTDFLISNINKRAKVICLSGKVLVYFTANPKEGRGLKPGQMVDVAAGATRIPAATTINLTTLLATSMLGEAGGLGPFPNQAAIEKNARNQQDAALLGRFLPGLNNLLTQPGSLPAQTMTTQAGQAARSITTANNIASQQLAAQQAAAQQARLNRLRLNRLRLNRLRLNRLRLNRLRLNRLRLNSKLLLAQIKGITEIAAIRAIRATLLAGVKATRVKATRVKATRDRATRDRARAIRDNPLARINNGSK